MRFLPLDATKAVSSIERQVKRVLKEERSRVSEEVGPLSVRETGRVGLSCQTAS
jgi:hypothetical protein